MLELWHGPTCAFKDMALQILPYFLTTAVKKLHMDKKVVILVATSGDTGKAALEGFKDVPGTEIMVFYPEEGVSDMQKRQMVTQEGENVTVCAVKGNFDDCQSGVKKIFTDHEVLNALDNGNMTFSSANSINWGRLVPQIVYYVSSYVSLAESGEIAYGDKLNVVVPTGNFGNILAAYYAKQMGVPIGKLICASNINKVLTDFIRTGVYDRNRQFYATTSPSMDILISSNLERLLYLLTGEDDAQVREWFTALAESGRYEVTDAVKAKMSELFYGGFCDDAATKATIAEIYQKYGYTCDTHTAVAVKVYEDYRKETGDTTKTLIASTASPFKFSASVLDALGKKPAEATDEYDMVEILHEASGLDIPASLAALKPSPAVLRAVSTRLKCSSLCCRNCTCPEWGEHAFIYHWRSALVIWRSGETDGHLWRLEELSAAAGGELAAFDRTGGYCGSGRRFFVGHEPAAGRGRLCFRAQAAW